MHRLDLGLYSHSKEFLGNGVRTHVNFKGKMRPPTGGSKQDRTRDAVLRRIASPTHYQLSYSGPYIVDSKRVSLTVHLTHGVMRSVLGMVLVYSEWVR